MLDEIKFNKAKEKAEQFYKGIDKVKCPFLNDLVHFNADGFEHVLFKSWNTPRSRQDQYVRLSLLRLAVQVISKSYTLQEYKECKRFERVQTNSKWNKEMKLVRYYTFMAILNNALIKVVIKEVEGRNKNFYSIIPKWRIENKDGQKNKLLYTGNPEED